MRKGAIRREEDVTAVDRGVSAIDPSEAGQADQPPPGSVGQDRVSAALRELAAASRELLRDDAERLRATRETVAEVLAAGLDSGAILSGLLEVDALERRPNAARPERE